MPRRRIETRAERQDASAGCGIILRQIRSVTNDCVRLFKTDALTERTKQYCICRLEAIRRNVELSTPSLFTANQSHELLMNIQIILGEFREHVVSTFNDGYHAERNLSTRGAPKYDISELQLRFLMKYGFTCTKMARLLGVSKRTIMRRLHDYGLRMRKFTVLTDDELDAAIKRIIRTNQQIGPTAVRTRLLSLDIKVQRGRVRTAMRRIDPEGVALRSASSIHRCRYRVNGPNSLWHCDGNHKLIRWRIVIHGCVDGYSRTLMFLEASNNNRKETVATYFRDAVHLYGLPSRIRVDSGGENNDMCTMMESLRGPNRGSAIRGTSVHNQRVERSWLDMWKGVTNLYYSVFNFLESRGTLNVDDNNSMWALHYTFLPRIKRDLKQFVHQWNNHPLRTERHSTPLQLFVERTLELSMTNLESIGDVSNQNLLENHMDPDSQSLTAGQVDVPVLQCPLDEEVLTEMKHLINPLCDDEDELGFAVYMKVLQYVNDHHNG